MTERPILFNDAMVRAILDGRKTQTRRVVKLNAAGRAARGGRNWHLDDPNVVLACPFGQPGDRLWVREAWARDDEDGLVMFRADIGVNEDATAWALGRADGVPRYRWRPSIHMPRSVCRLVLEVTGVRVERLNEISESDAQFEGCKAAFVGNRFAGYGTAFAQLWESINGAGSWDANPYVWVVEFRRMP